MLKDHDIRFMKEALKNYPVKDFPVPSKIEYAKIDIDTGYLALPTCPKVFLEAFREGTVPTEFCPYDHSAGRTSGTPLGNPDQSEELE